eukprot:6176002-Pleurochrysis_carterae.AAC.6
MKATVKGAGVGAGAGRACRAAPIAVRGASGDGVVRAGINNLGSEARSALQLVNYECGARTTWKQCLRAKTSGAWRRFNKIYLAITGEKS